MFPGLIGVTAHTIFIVDQRGHVGVMSYRPLSSSA
jgi:hypothetical protein